MKQIDPELLQAFLDETLSYLPQIQQSLEACVDNRGDAENLTHAHRLTHTIKGAAAMFGFADVSRAAGAIEDALDAVIAQTRALDDETLFEIFTSFEIVSEKLQQLAADNDYVKADGDNFDSSLLAAIDESVAQVEAAQVTNVQAVSFGAFDADELAAVEPEMLEVFQEEADEHLRVMSANLTTLERESDNRHALLDVRRSTHTLKGAAGVVGLRTIAQIAHRMEDLLDRLHDSKQQVTAPMLGAMLRSVDVIERLARGARPADFRAQLDAIADSYSEILNVEHETSDENFVGAGLVPARNLEPDSTRTMTKVDATSFPRDAHLDVQNALMNHERDEAQTNEAQAKRSNNRRVVRVPLERLDAVMKLVGELAISRTTLEQHLLVLHREVEELRYSNERLQRVSTKLETEYEASSLRSGRIGIAQLSDSHAAKNAEQLAANSEQLAALVTGQIINSKNASFDSAFLFGEIETANTHGFDELEFDRYTEFHRLSRELSETSSDTLAVRNELENLVGNFDAILMRQRSLTTDIQERLMRVRMVSLATLAARFERTVRVAADAEGKQVKFQIEGAHVELDTTVVDQMVDPLLHVLRNAVSHGIERPEVRRAIGKTEHGLITLRAIYEGTRVMIEVQDDGAGIDAAAVRSRAAETGFITEDEAAQMDDKQSLRLIFLAGLSTASRLSEISGRGIGMDVVKDHVANLQGTLDLDSTSGKGTRLTIRLPLTLAVTRALIVRAATETYAIPLTAVSQITRLDGERLTRARRESKLDFGDENYDVTHLTSWLNLPEDENAERAPVLILKSAGHNHALIVDEIIEGREIVIKSLGTHLRRAHGVMGATVLGDGRVIPILNPEDIVRGHETIAVASSSNGSTNANGVRWLDKPLIKQRGVNVLIVDDSPSVRRVMANTIRHHEWTPITAKDGLDALEKLHTCPAHEKPDVILLDVEMPRMDGYELLATLRQQEATRHIPVVMITSRTGEKHRRKALNLGASEYLTKPYLDDVLLAHIYRLTHQPEAE